MYSLFYTSIFFFFCTLYSTLSCAEYHYIGPTISWRNQVNSKNFKEPKYSHDYSLHNDRNISQIGLSHSHQPNFNQYNSQDFRDYFTTHKYTESQILDQRCLYMFDEFVKFAQTYPSYKKVIKQMHARLKNLSCLQKIYYMAKKTYCIGLQKRIQTLYNELTIIKTAQPNNNHNPRHNNNICPLVESRCNEPIIIKNDSITVFSQQKSAYESLKLTYQTYTPSLSKAIEKRLYAYNAMTSGDDYTLRYTTKSYSFDSGTEQLLHKYQYNPDQFSKHSTHQLGHAIHQESLDILERIAYLPHNSVLCDHQESLVDFTVAMNDYNHAGLTDKATQIGDFCWTLLDYGKAIAEGIALGGYSAAHDILTNPIESTICIVASKEVLAYQLCKVLYNVADIGVTALHDYDRACKKWDTYIEPINTIITAIQNKEISIRDAIKTGSALVVGYKSQAKLLGGLGKFFTTVKNKAINFAKHNSLARPHYYLTTPEGMVLKASHDAKNIGPASSGIVSPALVLLETTYAKIAIDLRKEIEFLRKKYDCIINGFAEIGYKKLKLDYEHIFGMDIRQSKKGKLDIGGFHLDFNNYIEKSGVLHFADKIIDLNGCYQCRLLNNGVFVKNATFFPASWTREKVVNKIYEAYKNSIKSGKIPEFKKNNKYKVEGCTSEGIRVEMFITQNGCITTAYPLL